jgi:glucosamine-6-phosphate deaminase
LDIQTFSSKQDMGQTAADTGASVIRQAIAQRGQASIIVATGASQFEVLDHLTKADGIDWTAVTAFHLDEYVGLPMTHPASFCLYLWRRFASRLPLPLKAFHYLSGVADAPTEAARVGAIIAEHPVDAAFIGIGENGHIAFNDPPADFQTQQPYLVVELDEACRRQQLGEGWFDTLNDVPKRAISMSVRQILKSKHIVCTVPDERKAQAVRGSVEGPVTPAVPASILQQHARCSLYLDKESASQLTQPVG